MSDAECQDEGKTLAEGMGVCEPQDRPLLDVVRTNTPEEVGKIFDSCLAAMGSAQAFDQLTEVHEGLPLIMYTVKRSSVPLFEAVFGAMTTALDSYQLTRIFARGSPRGNLPLLLLAAEEGSQEMFDAVLGALDRVAKVARPLHGSDTRLQDPIEHSGGRGVALKLPAQAEDLTLLQAIYSGNDQAVRARVGRSGSSAQRAVELLRVHAGRSPVMHAALVGSPEMVSAILGAMREAATVPERIEDALENRASKTSLLLSAAQGGSEDVFDVLMRDEAREQLLELFLEDREYGRAAILDAAISGEPTSFRAVVEILDKPLDKEQAIITLRKSSFDGSSDDDLRSSFAPNRHAVAARVAALCRVLPMNQMSHICTTCLQDELSGMDKTSTFRDQLEDRWRGRLSLLLACGAKVTPGPDGNLNGIFNSLGIVDLEKCFRQAIVVADNPFAPGMMLSLALAKEAPSAREYERRKLTELREMIEELLLEVLERLPQTVQGFPGGATTCSLLFEPEITGSCSEASKGPLKTAFRNDNLITTFCTRPLIVDFITHTFGAGLLNLRARVPSDKHAPQVASGVLKMIDPAVVARDPLVVDLQRNRLTLFPDAQFIIVGLIALPFTYYRVPLLRMCLDLAVFLVLLAVYTLVVAYMYDRSLVNPLEIALGFYVVAAIIAQASAIRRSNREYFRDNWNWLDVPALFLLSAGFLVRLWSTTSGNDLGQVGEALYLLVAPLLFPRILFFAQIHPSQGALIQVMIRMVSKVVQFAIVMMIVMMGFAVSFWASSERFRAANDDESVTFEFMWVAVFKAMLGDFGDMESLNEDPDWVDQVLFFFYVVVMTVMLLNLLIAILSTAHANIEERAETEIKASKVRTMEHYRRIVANDVLPAPLNLVQFLALFPIRVIDLCIQHGLYDRLKPTVGRFVGSFVFWVISSPVAIVLGSLLWFVSTPYTVINKWDLKISFWKNLSRSVGVVFESLIFVPLALVWLWALGVIYGARQIVDLAQGNLLGIQASVSFFSDTHRRHHSVGEILIMTGGLGVYQLSACLEDPMGDPEVRRDEENEPTTVKHIKLLRNRLEETNADRLADIVARIESAASARERRLEDMVSGAIVNAIDERVDRLEKRLEKRLEEVLTKLAT